MDDLRIIEDSYREYVTHLDRCLPEGILEVDLNLLQRFDLIDYQDKKQRDPALTRYFHVIESHEKITLINDQFVIWIVPEKVEEVPVTYTLIALNQEKKPHLEMAFATSGVYNSSHLVLGILEKFLMEIQENEDLLNKFKKP